MNKPGMTVGSPPIQPFSPGEAGVINRIDQLLPQTQCRRCGYAGCRPYAEAIAADETDINRCPPGGDATIMAIARLLRREAKPLDTTCGEHTAPARAVVDEDLCIGCTKCIQACPVDAIVGSAKRMHTVINDECTGCELCLPPCPVDCISMIPAGPDRVPAIDASARTRAERARRRFAWRNVRLSRGKSEAQAARQGRSAGPARLTLEQKKTAIQAAVARVKAKRAARLDST